jgi:uroporphyrinogen decarboxylase
MTAVDAVEAAAIGGMRGRERLLAAARCQPVDTTPAWYMRQAGGSLPGYLALRERHSVEEIARTPELCAAVSLMPVEAYGVDGAVMFADIMLPVAAMGVDLVLTPTGPVIDAPFRTAADVARLRPLDAHADVPFVLEAIATVRRELDGRAAVIGLTGGPFTLACYLIEGGPSRDQTLAKAFMHREPTAWAALMDRLADALGAYVRAQVEAGADVVQVFDTWAGSLSPADYVRFARPWTRRVLAAVEPAPAIHFGVAVAGIFDEFAEAGGDVVGIDARQSLAAAWARLGPHRAVQGNLEPALLLAGWEALEAGARRVLGEAGGRPGHIFNLGHAAPREADPGLLRELTALVHEIGSGETP